MPSFAEQLTAARKAAGMTQEELSAAVHVARNTISNWEHERTEPDLDTLRQLGQILHTDFLNGAAAPAEQDQAPQPEGSGTASGGDAPARKPDKKKLLALCAALLVVVAVEAGLLISRSIRMSKTAEVSLTALHDPAPMIADPAFEDEGLGWEFTFVITNASDVPFKPEKGVMVYYKNDAVAGNMDLDYAFLRGCMYGDTITNTDPAPVNINWGASYPLFTRVELQIQGTDANGHAISLKTKVDLSQEKPQQ